LQKKLCDFFHAEKNTVFPPPKNGSEISSEIFLKKNPEIIPGFQEDFTYQEVRVALFGLMPCNSP
jgi:hypothetical protein